MPHDGQVRSPIGTEVLAGIKRALPQLLQKRLVATLVVPHDGQVRSPIGTETATCVEIGAGSKRRSPDAPLCMGAAEIVSRALTSAGCTGASGADLAWRMSLTDMPLDSTKSPMFMIVPTPKSPTATSSAIKATDAAWKIARGMSLRTRS